jgi:hypothetical protein
VPLSTIAPAITVPWPPRNFRAEFEGPAECRRREGVIDDQRHAVRVRDRREPFEIGDVPARVADRLAEQQPRILLHRRGERRGIVARHERARDAHAFERDRELRDRAAVEARACDDVIARFGK